MATGSLLIGYCLLVALASFSGGWLPLLIRMTHLRTQLLMSFVAGLMLGIAMLHLLPHAVETIGSAGRCGAATLAGVIGMFLLMRAFHPHSHDHGRAGATNDAAVPQSLAPGLGWLGMLFGLGLHTVMDGVALASSVVVDASHGAWLGLAGLGTFLAVALHKPLDAFSIASVMRREGWTSRQSTLVNLVFCAACPLGAALFWIGATQLGIEWLVGYGLAISAGFFICIALSDLLPEVHFHDHDRGKLTAALLMGIALAVAIENLPGHHHGPAMTPTTGQSDHSGHDHSGHDHGHSGHDHSGHDHPRRNPFSDLRPGSSD